VSGVAPPKPVVNIKYRVGDETTIQEWAGGEADKFISRVSVFTLFSHKETLPKKLDLMRSLPTLIEPPHWDG
jgi:hypothetical protein